MWNILSHIKTFMHKTHSKIEIQSGFKWSFKNNIKFDIKMHVEAPYANKEIKKTENKRYFRN